MTHYIFTVSRRQMTVSFHQWTLNPCFPPPLTTTTIHWPDFCICAPIILSRSCASHPMALRSYHSGERNLTARGTKWMCACLKLPWMNTHSCNHNESWHELFIWWHSNLEAKWPLLSLLPCLVSTVWIWKGQSLKPVSVFSLLYCVWFG